MKLYTLGGKFVKNENIIPVDFTGISEYINGTKHWYTNGKYHRVDGPACEWYDGEKRWFVNGRLHRFDGPAVEWCNGDKQWFVDGKEVTKEQHNLLVSIMKLKGFL